MTFQQNSLSALVPTVPMVPVGMGGSCSSLLPQHPCQQQIQSTGIQEFRKGSPAFEAAKALEFSWFCFLGLIHHMAQSQGMRAIFQCNGFTVKWDYGFLKPLDKPPKIPYVHKGTYCPQSPSLRNSYSASPPSQTAEELCSGNSWYVIVTSSPFILLRTFTESHEVPSSSKKEGLRDWIMFLLLSRRIQGPAADAPANCDLGHLWA